MLTPRHLGIGNKLGRVAWQLVWMILYRPTPRIFHPWRCLLLRLFGARLGVSVHPYPSARIWAPWNLVMGDHSCLSEGVDCYCVDKITLGRNVTVSQNTHLCSASHDFRDPAFPLVTAPIVVQDEAWIAADAFIGPGVTVGEGAVVGARACVFRDVESWVIVGGNPARVIGRRRA